MSDLLQYQILWIIFVNLPAKSLLRFKSVCKLWYYLISDHNFINFHSDQSEKNNRNHIILKTPKLHMIPYGNRTIHIELEYPFMNFPAHRAVYVEQACRGLICFTMDIFPYDIYLYNPTTRTHKTLPGLLIKAHPKGHSYLGFGYDHKSRDYKCVQIFQWLKPIGYELVRVKSRVMVYSLRRDGWVYGSKGVPYDLGPYHKHAVHLNGVLHWWGEECDGSPLPIIGYNLSNDSFSSVSIPDTRYDYSYTCSHLGVLDGCLCLTLNFSDDFEVWIMKEYGIKRSWTKRLKVGKEIINQELKPICFLNRKILLVNFPKFNVSYLFVESKIYKRHRISSFHKIENAFVCSENLLVLKNSKDDVLGWQKRQRTMPKRKRL